MLCIVVKLFNYIKLNLGLPFFGKGSTYHDRGKLLAERKKLLKDLNNKNKIRSFQRRRAIKQKEFRRARKVSWHKYINSLNARTPTRKVWERF